MTTWESDTDQRDEEFYITGPHVGYDLLQVIDVIKSLKNTPKKLMDVGTGTGRLCVEAAKVFPQMTSLGVDADLQVVAYARNLAFAEGVSDRCDFRVHNATHGLPDFLADVTTFLAARGIYPLGDYQLAAMIRAATEASNSIALVDGIWTSPDRSAVSRRVDDFEKALLDAGLKIVERLESPFKIPGSEQDCSLSFLWAVRRNSDTNGG